MKHALLLFFCLLASYCSRAQTLLQSQSFENGEMVNYTTNSFNVNTVSGTATQKRNQYFQRATQTSTNVDPPPNTLSGNGSATPSWYYLPIVGGALDGSYFFAGEAVRGPSSTDQSIAFAREPGNVTLNTLNVAGKTNLQVKVALLDGRGTYQNWASNSDLKHSNLSIQVNLDGTGWTTIGQFAPDTPNSFGALRLDANFDGVGDAGAPQLTTTFTDFTFTVTGSASTMQTRVLADINGLSTEFGFDNIRVLGTTASSQPPVLANIESAPLAYNEGGAAIQITNTITVADPDNTMTAGATVKFNATGFTNTEDRLLFTNQNGITGSYNTSTGVLALSGTATLGAYQTALRSVQYQNIDANNASPATRSVAFSVTDPSGVSSNLVSRSITVTTHLDAASGLPYSEDFETDGEGTRYGSNHFSTGANTLSFLRTNINPYDTPGTAGATTFSNLSNTTYWYGSATTNPANPNAVKNGILTTKPLSTTGYANLQFQLRLGASVATATPNPATWQTTDYFKLYYRIAGSSTWTVFGSFRGTATSLVASGTLKQDSDPTAAPGSAAPTGASVSTTLTNFSFGLPSSLNGQTLEFQLVQASSDGSNDLAFDLLQLTGTQVVAPSVTTATPTGVGTTTAVLGGNVTADGGATVTKRGVVYSITNTMPTIGGANVTVVPNVSGTSTFSAPISNLSPGTSYSVAAYATNSSGTGYGSVNAFVTTPNAPVVTALANGTTIATRTPTYTGTAQNGATITVYVDGSSIGTTTANGGNWSFTQPVALIQGSHTVYARATITVNGTTSPASVNSNVNTFSVDTVAPTITNFASTVGASGSNTAISPFPFSVTFSESVTGLSAGGIQVTNGSVTSGPTGNGSGPYTFEVTPTTPFIATTVQILANAVQDQVGLGNPVSSLYTLTYRPAVTAAPVVVSPANGSLLATNAPNYAGTAPSGSTVTVFVDGSAIGTTTATGGNWSLTQPVALAQGSHTVRATAQTAGSVGSANSNTSTFTIDTVRPAVSIASTAGASGSTTGTSPIPFSVTFSESVTGFVADDLSVSNGTVSGFSGSGTTYSFNVTPSANGAVVVNVPTSVAQDAAGNPNTAASSPYTITYSATPTITGFAASSNAVCTGNAVAFSATIGNVTGNYTYTLTNGTGTSLTGTASGTAFSQSVTASGTGTQTFTLTVSTSGQSASSVTTLTVNPLPVASLTNNGPLSCAQTSVTLTANGGTSYTFVSGSGVIGTPGAANTVVVSAPGTYSVTVASASGCVSSTSTTVISNTAVVTVSNPVTTTATINASFSQPFTASGGSGPYSYSVASGSLPPGLNLATTGVLSGTPTQVGSFTITVKATDATGCSGISTPYVLTVTAPAMPIRYVRAGASGSGDSWADASGDLQSQINLVGAQQVWVARGTYKPGGDANADRTISFAMKNGVAIYGGFVGTETTLSQRPTINPVSGNPSSTTLSGDIGTAGNDSDNSYHIIYNLTGLTTTAVLDGFVLTAGRADGSGSGQNSGGGIFNDGSGTGKSCSPLIQNCLFQNNRATENGAALFNDGSFTGRSNPVVTNCLFANNLASSGGAILNQGASSGSNPESGSSPVLTNCLFLNNTATDTGGAITNNAQGSGRSNPALTNCFFRGNTAANVGGAIHNNGIYSGFSSPTLINCSFQSNAAKRGGAIYNDAYGDGTSSPTLTNCSFQNNSASEYGGAMYSKAIVGNAVSTPTLTNCVVFGNGGGNTFSRESNSSVVATYSLFDDSVGDYSGSNNLTTTVSPFVSTTDTRLNACSPAINAGLNSANSTATDLAGNARVFGSRIDMGAYEYQAAPTGVTITAPSVSTATVGVAFSQPFTASGGTSPYSYSLASGSLPAGISLATTGVLSGTPTQVGSFTITVKATDASSCSGVSAAYVLTVNPPACGAGLTGPIWTGCLSTNWNTAGNWASGAVPTATDDVVIPSAPANQPVLSTPATAKSVEVQSGASLSITATGTLTINDSKSLDGNTVAFSNQGTVQNAGQLVLGNTAAIGQIGFWNRGITNNVGGQISIDRSTSSALLNSSGTFTNTGAITIGSNASVGGYGLRVDGGTVANNPGGDITINRAAGLLNDATFVNASRLTIGNVAFSAQDCIYSRGAFTNTATGEIRVDRAFSNGIWNAGGTFRNDGKIAIGTVAYSGAAGILVDGTSFVNSAGADIQIDRVNRGLTNRRNFTNAGQIRMGNQVALGERGLQNGNDEGTVAAVFTNQAGGLIQIDQTAANQDGITNKVMATFTNVGTVAIGTLGSIGGNGIGNEGTFTNSACTTLTVVAPINNTNSFTNAGLFIVSTTRAHSNTGTLTNNGLISYPQGNPIPNVVNNDVIAAPISSCGNTITPPLQLGGNSSQFAVGTTWYTDPALTQSAGTYNQASNTFTATNLAPGSRTTLYVAVTDKANGCAKTVPVSVTLNAAVTASISPTNPTLTCASPTVSLTASGGSSYVWDDRSTNAVRTVNSSGTYSVTVSTGAGCSAVATTTVGSNTTPPDVSLSASNGGVLTAANPSVTLTASPGAASYAFSPGASQVGGSSGNTATVTTPGVYSVTVTGTNGCTATASTSVTTTATPASSQTLCRNSTVVLTTIRPAARYEWYKNGQTAANKLSDIAGVQRGTATASLTLVSLQTSATYYVKEIQASGSFTWSGPFTLTVDARCTARIGLEEPTPTLSVLVTPNPVLDNRLQASIGGAEGGPLTVQLVDSQGYAVQEQYWEQAAPTESISWDVSRWPAGVYILQAQTKNQRQTIKVLKL